MRRALLALFAFSALTGSALAQDAPQSFGQIERGKYLTKAGDCAACHTAPGGKPFAGGYALETPFGKILSANITPDRKTGIGAWTDDEFVAALHDGIGKGGKHLYPAMPYPAYTKISRADALAIRAYLNTIEPVDNKVVTSQLPFPFNIRESLAAWNVLNFTAGRFKPDPNQSDEWNRGAYLVTGLSHCVTCHTPKNLMGGDKTSSPLTGGTLQGWYAPNITANKHNGIGGWSTDEIVQYLKTGANDKTLASGPMGEEITHGSSAMTDSDLKAIAVYLKSVGANKADDKPAALATSDKRMVVGEAIFKDNCSACHTESGAGASHIFPSLAKSPLVQSDDPTTLIRVVLGGSRAVSTKAAPTSPAMPSFGWRLKDEQIAAVLTYIRNAWGNSAAAVDASAVKKMRGKLSANVE
jgi:mono/diheme cytochrome c family protein